MLDNPIKFLNLTDQEVRGIQNGTCTQLVRRSKNPDARTRHQIKTEQEVFGAAGQVVGGRESWRCISIYPDNAQVTIEYRAGGRNFWDNIPDLGKFTKQAAYVGNARPWHPAHHQPKFSIRVALEIGDVHIHRLMDLREEDARYIGLEPTDAHYYDYMHPGHENPELWNYPWRDYELKTFNGEPSARDSFFSWYRYNHGKTNFQANDWLVRAEIKLIETPKFLLT